VHYFVFYEELTKHSCCILNVFFVEGLKTGTINFVILLDNFQCYRVGGGGY